MYPMLHGAISISEVHGSNPDFIMSSEERVWVSGVGAACDGPHGHDEDTGSVSSSGQNLGVRPIRGVH